MHRSGIFHTNIEKDTIENKNYRKVINTTTKQQLVLMSLKPNEDIECEMHSDVDQFFRIEKGKGVLYASKESFCDKPNNSIEQFMLKDGDVIVVPAGTYHRVVNTSTIEELKLYTIYSPPNHPSNKIDVIRPMSGGPQQNKYIVIKKK